jgi:hypothetical protein
MRFFVGLCQQQCAFRFVVPNLPNEACLVRMSFSLSTFTIEIKSVAMVAFQAKWHDEADRVCRQWLQAHWGELAASGPAGIELPPISKLRLARPAERAAYEAAENGVEFVSDVKVVKLAVAAPDRFEPPQLGSQTSDSGEDADHRIEPPIEGSAS